MTKSAVGTTTGNFHPIVLDNFLVTTSLTLLNRRRAENVFGSLSNDVVFNNGKLNFRFVSTIGSESNGFVGNIDMVGGGVGGVVVVVIVVRGFVIEAVPSADVPTYTRSGDSISLAHFLFSFVSG